MARRRRRSHGRHYRGRSIRHHRRGTLGHKFLGIFKRPVSYIITPTLGGLGLATIFMAPDSSGISAVGHIINAGQAMAKGQATDQLNYVTGAAIQGLGAATPLLIGAAAAGVIGKIFKV
jgi:hypothetical protein